MCRGDGEPTKISTRVKEAADLVGNVSSAQGAR